MKRATIVFRSRTGTTRRLGEEIGAFLGTRGIEPWVVSVGDCDMAGLATSDYLLLGCWTSGLFVIGQHPDQPWLDFARDLPTVTGARVGLFTTYKLATGSMFPRMRERLVGKLPAPTVQIKSRGGRLSAGDREALERFIGGD